MTGNEKTKLPAIQLLRGFAASLVFLDHGLSRMRDHFANPEKINALAIQLGDCGVWIFFIISGFIMIRSHGHEFGGTQNWRRVMIKRIARILPIYGLLTGLVFLLALRHQGHVPFFYLGKSLFFIPFYNVLSNQIQPLLSQGWTLNYEMFFYVLFALCLSVPRRGGFWILIASLTILGLAGFVLPAPYSAHQDPSFLFYYTKPLLLFFVVGCLAGAAYPSVLRRFPKSSSQAQKESKLMTFGIRTGDASYSLYLTHGFCLDLILKTLHKTQMSFSVYGYLATSALLAWGVGVAVYRWVERPLTRYVMARALRG